MRAALPFMALICLLVPTFGDEAKEASTTIPKIAVLRLEQVMRESKLYRAGKGVLEKIIAEDKSQLTKLEDKYKELENDLQVIPPTDERFAAKNVEFEMIKVQRKMMAENDRTDIDKRHSQLLKSSYETLHQLLKEYCHENGILLVHLVPQAELQQSSVSDLQLQLGMQSLLYYDPSLDITDAFLAYANSRYVGDAHSDVPLSPLAPPAAPTTATSTPAQGSKPPGN